MCQGLTFKCFHVSLRFPAFHAGTEHLQSGIVRYESLFRADILLKTLELITDEFDNVSALETNEMMMVRSSKSFFIPRSVLRKAVL